MGVDQLAEEIANLPKARGVDRTYAPGERGDAVLREREANGIPLPVGTWDKLLPVAQRFGVEMPVVVS